MKRKEKKVEALRKNIFLGNKNNSLKGQKILTEPTLQVMIVLVAVAMVIGAWFYLDDFVLTGEAVKVKACEADADCSSIKQSVCGLGQKGGHYCELAGSNQDGQKCWSDQECISRKCDLTTNLCVDKINCQDDIKCNYWFGNDWYCGISNSGERICEPTESNLIGELCTRPGECKEGRCISGKCE